MQKKRHNNILKNLMIHDQNYHDKRKSFILDSGIVINLAVKFYIYSRVFTVSYCHNNATGQDTIQTQAPITLKKMSNFLNKYQSNRLSLLAIRVIG